jgi:sugar lactone lactonase YvrE
MKRSALVLGLLVLALSQFVSAAGAATPPFFTQFPEDTQPGSAADQLLRPNGVAVGPMNHHVYVSDPLNRRISEYTAWGEFVKAFGEGVQDGSNEFQTCTSASGCRQGLAGTGKGEFGEVPQKSEYIGPTGLAIDSAGSLYALDLGNFRIQKFDSEGNFLLMFGGGVNKSRVEEREEEEANSEPITVTAEEENICTQASGDECGAGSPGTGPGEFAIENVLGVNGDYLAFAPDGLLYVGDRNRIQAFATDGGFDHALPLPEAGNPGGLAADPVSGDLYFTFNDEHLRTEQTAEVYRLNPDTGNVFATVEPRLSKQGRTDIVTAVAVDAEGNLYVTDDPYLGNQQVLKYSSSGQFQGSFDEAANQDPATPIALESGIVTGDGESDLYVGQSYFVGPPTSPGNMAAIRVFGAVPDPAVVGPPPKVPPSIAEQFATSVGTTEATLKAAINPHFWTDTTYYLQYGTGRCSEGGCATEVPLPPGRRLGETVVQEAVTTTGILVAGLQPATTYHYRFVTQSSGSEGQPVIGGEASFTTRTLPPPPNEGCPNQSFRIGPGAFLPDCRAYEMVSPVDKNGADVSVAKQVTGFPAGLDQAEPSGEGITYSASRAFADALAGPYTSQYVARRDPSTGWSTHAISPAAPGGTALATPILDREFKAFSPDLQEGWLLNQGVTPLDPAAPVGYANLYRRTSEGSYEAMINVQPPVSPQGFVPEVQGFGGDCTIFVANAKLTEDAAPSDPNSNQVYENCGGKLSLVSVLPTGKAAAQATVGTGDTRSPERTGTWAGAVSRDASVIFWSNKQAGPGQLFARLEGATTIALSKSGVPAQFLTAAPDGSRAVYADEFGGTQRPTELREFTLGVNKKESGTLIAGGFEGFLGASEDTSKIYFLSTEELDEGAEAGKPNLYLYEAASEAGQAGTYTYITTLAASEAGSEGGSSAGPVFTAPFFHTAQATPDGDTLVFDSVTPLTGYDNKDGKTGKPDTEVFVYRARSDSLACVSCDPSGARPAGQEVGLGGKGNLQPLAATINGAQSALYMPRAISTDGSRTFFTSYVPLAPRDSNGRADVYEWEAAGSGDCLPGTLGYDATWQGCVNLISSGESVNDSIFVDSSSDGRDAFFKTYSSLRPEDPGLRDIYDARVGGGFPLPLVNPAACEGEACQSPAAPPNDPTPSSVAFDGAGNLTPPKKHKKRHHRKRKAGKHRHHPKSHGKQRKTR